MEKKKCLCPSPFKDKDYMSMSICYLLTRPHASDTNGTPGIKHGDEERGFQKGGYRISCKSNVCGVVSVFEGGGIDCASRKMLRRSVRSCKASCGKRSP
mmetsp:Transcript_29849/g.44398  ORF Transcript_29849/g.44398 Transcript_29849/m.44398 type:complete len:99 (-) Transcript_29849:996-1292(-)